MLLNLVFMAAHNPFRIAVASTIKIDAVMYVTLFTKKERHKIKKGLEFFFFNVPTFINKNTKCKTTLGTSIVLPRKVKPNHHDYLND